MPLAEAEIRPRKPLFHLSTAEAILAEAHGRDRRQRAEVARPAARRSSRVLRKTLAAARKSAEAELMATGKGLRCAQNLAPPQDEIIRAVHQLRDRARSIRSTIPRAPRRSRSRPSAAMAAARWRRAPTSICSSSCPTSRRPGASRSPNTSSICSGTSARRSATPCARSTSACAWRKSDMTVRTATLEARYLTGDKALFDQLEKRFETEIMPKTGPEFIAAKMAEREERHQQMGNTRYVVEPNVKDGKGGPARPQHAVLDRQVLLPRQDRRRAGRQGRALGRRVSPVPARRGFPLGDPLQPPLPHRPRRRQADLRPAARARRSASASSIAPACSASSG